MVNEDFRHYTSAKYNKSYRGLLTNLRSRILLQRICTAGNAATRLQQQEGADKARHMTVNAGNSGILSSEPSSIGPSYLHSNVVPSASLVSRENSTSGRRRGPMQWSRSVDEVPEKAESLSGHGLPVSSTSVTRSHLSASLSTSASLSYYYYSPAMALGNSTNSASSTRVGRLQRSLTQPETSLQTTGVVKSPEIASETGVSAISARNSENGEKLERDLSLEAPDMGQNDDNDRVKSPVMGEYNGGPKTRADITIPDTSRPACGNMTPRPSSDSICFSSIRQAAAHNSFPARGENVSVQSQPRSVDVSLVTVPIRDAMALSESFDTPPDDVFLPELASDGPRGLEQTAELGRATEPVGEAEEEDGKDAIEEHRSRRDSFNRPDSPMFYTLIELPRDSVILRNRRRRRRNDSLSSSSSSSSFLAISRRYFDSGIHCAPRGCNTMHKNNLKITNSFWSHFSKILSM